PDRALRADGAFHHPGTAATAARRGRTGRVTVRGGVPHALGPTLSPLRPMVRRGLGDGVGDRHHRLAWPWRTEAAVGFEIASHWTASLPFPCVPSSDLDSCSVVLPS